MQVFDHCYLIAGARRHPEFELHHLPFLRQLHLVDLVQSLNAALHLGGLGGMGAETVDKALFLGQHGLLPGKRSLQIGLSNGPFAFVEIVVA